MMLYNEKRNYQHAVHGSNSIIVMCANVFHVLFVLCNVLHAYLLHVFL